VSAARSWLGTPYQHQARCKGAGVDCAGLIVGVAAQLRISQFDFTNYGRQPLGDTLRDMMRSQTSELPSGAPWQAGQIALMRFKDEPQHLGIIGINPLPLGEGRVRAALGDEPTLIHAYGHAGKVVEHRLADVWRARIMARYDYHGVV
jgi:hypothetical protein